MYNDLAKINREIALSRWTPELVVGINRGGLVPAVHISHYWDVEMVPVSLSLRDFKGRNLPELPNKNILIVDDIVDSGDTLLEIIKHYQNLNIRTAALIYNEGQKCHSPTYYGKVINKFEKDVWITFPWEF